MAIQSWRIKVIWILWLAIVPIGTWLLYTIYPPQSLTMESIIAFIVISAVASLLPIMVNGTPVFFVQWITLAAFLMYGLFFEMILMQLSAVILLIGIRIRRDEWYRFATSSLMFFMISIFSSSAYYLAGGNTGEVNISHILIPIIVYQAVNFSLNQVILHYSIHFVGKDKSFFTIDLLWDFFTLILVIPLSLAFYTLQDTVGNLSSLLLAVPFLCVSYVLKMYNNSEVISKDLQKITEVGHQLTERLNVEEVLDVFIQKITDSFHVDYAYILDSDNDHFEVLRRIGNYESQAYVPDVISKKGGVSGVIWETKKGVIYQERKEWRMLDDRLLPDDAQSVLGVPIVRNKRVVGVLILVSISRCKYVKHQLMITDILCSYFGVAIENARHYERTKQSSERCGLTKLYNYRYFDQVLSQKFLELEKGVKSCLSLIMLDIDHFKSINDTYGHQSGNEILIELANCLSCRVGPNGTLARYGGEEFVILLEDVSKQEAYEFAEEIRHAISVYPFVLENSITESEKPVIVQITASIGVAVAPDDADDAMSLIRHADRALYIGAKRAGRNRVAEYAKV